ncbi:MAG: chitobiase/beta-hexosaminidase C-terminal domain-containing protein [Saprospiraceae bacterium]|jgi:hypothetical protein|nr:chitobiase/beta-hexosaminidase C-terminal domain-containing protein [Saprospiraceae bacterium]MDP4821842.1 chitobiase/beta-hexosaminidase C-terminal domain-containing protein [Saprospiraceae bacterium]
MSRLLFVVLMLGWFIPNLAGNATSIMPFPQKWEPGSELLELRSTDVSHYFVEKPSPNNIFALNQLILFWEANQALRLTPGTKGKSDLLVGKLGLYDKLDEVFPAEDIERVGEEGYLIRITTERIFLAANSDAGLFYGIQSLRQYLLPYKDRKIPTGYIADWPDTKVRAWEDDWRSKGTAGTDYLKDQVKKMAVFKLNTLIVNSETALPKPVLDDLNKYAGLYHVKVFVNARPEGDVQEARIGAAGKIWPDLRQLATDVRAAAVRAKASGAAGLVLQTVDEGYFGFFESFVWPIVWGGVHLWNAEKSSGDEYLAAFNALFDRLYFNTAAPAAEFFLEFSNLGQLEGMNRHSVEKSWEDYSAQLDLTAEQVQKLSGAMDNFQSRTRSYLQQVSQNVYTFDCFQFAVNWSKWMQDKQRVQVVLHQMVEGTPVPEDVMDQVAGLRRDLFALRQMYQTLWKKERKDQGLEADLRFFDVQTEATINLPYEVFAQIQPSDSLFAIDLVAVNDTLPIFYTLDGSDPSENSLRFEATLHLPESAVLKARTVSNRYQGPVATIQVLRKAKAKADNGMATSFSPLRPPLRDPDLLPGGSFFAPPRVAGCRPRGAK